MLSKLLIKIFIKNSENIQDNSVRDKYGYFAGIVGIVFNLLLFFIKLFVGIITGSIAVTADAFNNLSDTISSIITILGFRLSNLPPDKEHPFGHGRSEYIASLIMSFIILMVGLDFAKSSITRILNPTPVHFDILTFILLLITIIVKIWLSLFNRFIGKKINSKALEISAFDSLGDVFASSIVLISFVVARFTSIPLDGYVGLFVSLFILYAGYKLLRETISPLLGESPDPKLVDSIKEELLSYDYITGVHDLIIHNYGVGKFMASIHAEIPANIDIMTIHNVIDLAEREISEKLKIVLVVHMDPISIEENEVKSAKELIEKIISKKPIITSIHDFRIIGKGEKKSLIFDVVIRPDDTHKKISDDEIIQFISEETKKIHKNYKCIITVDREFI